MSQKLVELIPIIAFNNYVNLQLCARMNEYTLTFTIHQCFIFGFAINAVHIND